MLLTQIKTVFKPHSNQARSLFHWLNIVFNQVNEDRRKIVGPDRSCAEWLLRNGAYVKFNYCPDLVTDYNALPDDEVSLHIVEVNATESSISHYGFAHFVGCNHIKKIIFHKCSYLEDKALQELSPLKNSLQYLQISECLNISDNGLSYLTALSHLQQINLCNLPYVKDSRGIVGKLRAGLPQCNIQFA